jgi:hypothetical protein
MKRFYIIIFIFITANYVYPQFPVFKLFPSSVNQIEPVIVHHPLNQQMLFASSYTINTTSFVRNEGVYVSTNGGVNWFGSDIVYDGYPQFHNGDPGPIIDKNGIFLITHWGPALQDNRFYSNYSTNSGANWSTAITCFPTNNSQDKGSVTTDGDPASPYYGNSYAVCAVYESPIRIIFSKTTNSGINWSDNMIYVNQSAASRNSFGPYIVVGPAGKLYVSWASTKNISPFNELGIGFASSTNAGTSWTANEIAYNCNGIRTTQLSPWNIRVNSYPSMAVDKSGGPRNGWIYIVTCEKDLSPAGTDPDVILHRSTNGGSTWSSGIRVNRDALNNGKIQYFPAIDVDEDGGINIIYYDTRNTPSNDSVQVYLSRSQDGGNNWRDFIIAGSKFYPQPVLLGGAGNQGDNIGIVSANNKLYPVWMARYPGESVYQVWSSIINISSVGINKISEIIPGNFDLSQNYPNPFNPKTKIRYNVPASSDVTLNIYNINGKLVHTLVNGYHSPGEYEVDFDFNNAGIEISSGVYFYRLQSGSNVISKKMILTK